MHLTYAFNVNSFSLPIFFVVRTTKKIVKIYIIRVRYLKYLYSNSVKYALRIILFHQNNSSRV